MHRASLIGFVLAVLVLFAGLRPAFTQEIPVEGTEVQVTEEDAAGHEHTEKYNLGNPEQLKELIAKLKAGRITHIVREKPVDIFGLSVDLGLYTVVIFGLLCLILKKVAWGPMLEGLHHREESIHGALAEAHKAREEAKALRDQLQQEMDKAGDSVRAMLDEGRRDAQRLSEEMLGRARAEMQTERDRLHREMEMARDQAVQEIWNQTAQLATLVSAKTIRKQLTPEDHRRLVDETLAEMHTTVGAKRQEVWSKV